MSSRTQRQAAPASERRGRGCLRLLVGMVILVLGLLLAGTVYEAAAEAADARNYPIVGQMVDVGGYRLHINCTGAGSPSVVIDAGWGDWSLKWNAVQEAVSKTTHVCTYDRAGMGYSEAGPLPRTAGQVATELHTLLERAAVPGPYVLVGHSLGGLPVRVFADAYPADVSGVVLIDSMSPRQMTQPATATESQPSAQAGGVSLASLAARVGLVRLLNGPLGIIKPLPSEANAAYTAFSVAPRSVQAWSDEGAALQQSLAQADAVNSFGDLPLIVLTAGLSSVPDWQSMQAELLQLSSNSRQILLEDSGHDIAIDKPEAAVAAIVQMVEQLR